MELAFAPLGVSLNNQFRRPTVKAKGSLDSEKGKSADIEPGKIAEKARTNFKIQIYGLGIIILLPIIIIMIGVNLKKR